MKFEYLSNKIDDDVDINDTSDMRTSEMQSFNCVVKPRLPISKSTGQYSVELCRNFGSPLNNAGDQTPRDIIIWRIILAIYVSLIGFFNYSLNFKNTVCYKHLPSISSSIYPVQYYCRINYFQKKCLQK